MKYILFLITAILVASCGPTVGLDYDKNTDFSRYKTYTYYPSIESGLSELDDKRIMRAMDSLLQEKGFIKSDYADISINFFAKEQLGASRNTLGVGVGSGGGGFGIGGSVGIPIGGNAVEQQLTVDFIDVTNDALVWQAVLDGTYKEKIKPAQKDGYYITVLKKALSKYPPKQK